MESNYWMIIFNSSPSPQLQVMGADVIMGGSKGTSGGGQTVRVHVVG